MGTAIIVIAVWAVGCAAACWFNYCASVVSNGYDVDRD